MNKTDADALLPDPGTSVVDEAEHDPTVAPQQYKITSFGADWDVEGVVNRLKRGDLFIPPFQRDYVWTPAIASRFIESLLLGLPVPGVFVARETASNKLIVIDGQQRLKTLQFFFDGVFDPRPDSETKRVFRLTRVQQRFEGKTYDTLDEKDRIKLRDAVIHATIVRQDTPEDDDTSVYHIFQRLNQGARRLTPQEMRSALYRGTIIDLIKELNKLPVWRRIFGLSSKRLKDQELILRFLGLYFELDRYEQPMEEFLNRFASRHRHDSAEVQARFRDLFTRTITVLDEALGRRAFRLERVFNAAVFDSVMVGVARRLQSGEIEHTAAVRNSYESLLQDTTYRVAVSRATANETNINARISGAIEAFANVP